MQLKIKLIGIFSVMLLLVSCIGSSLAFWSVSSDTINSLNMDSLSAAIEEEYTRADHIMPGETIDKVVNVRNTGSSDIFVRVKVSLALGDFDESGRFMVNTILDPDKITIPYHDTYWFYEDGYYYYKGILKTNERTKESLFDQFTFATDINQVPYALRAGEIIISMEAIQTDGNAPSLWQKTYSDFGVERPMQTVFTDTSVTYLGKKDKFDIELSKTDLFANFKDLLPGCGRTELIHVTNQSSDQAEIFLRAESTENEGDMALIEDLLKKYATITIKNQDAVIYEGAVWGNLDAANGSMKENISLGTFNKNETKNLSVFLNVDPLMDNRYQRVLGKVKWVFTVSGGKSASDKDLNDKKNDDSPSSSTDESSSKSQHSSKNKKASSNQITSRTAPSKAVSGSVKTADLMIYVFLSSCLVLGLCGIAMVSRKITKGKGRYPR